MHARIVKGGSAEKSERPRANTEWKIGRRFDEMLLGGKSWPAPIPRHQHQEDVAVIMRSRLAVAAAVGLWLAPQTFAQQTPQYLPESGRASANQKTADAVASRLH